VGPRGSRMTTRAGRAQKNQVYPGTEPTPGSDAHRLEGHVAGHTCHTPPRKLTAAPFGTAERAPEAATGRWVNRTPPGRSAAATTMPRPAPEGQVNHQSPHVLRIRRFDGGRGGDWKAWSYPFVPAIVRHLPPVGWDQGRRLPPAARSGTRSPGAVEYLANGRGEADPGRGRGGGTRIALLRQGVVEVAVGAGFRRTIRVRKRVSSMAGTRVVGGRA